MNRKSNKKKDWFSHAPIELEVFRCLMASAKRLLARGDVFCSDRIPALSRGDKQIIIPCFAGTW